MDIHGIKQLGSKHFNVPVELLEHKTRKRRIVIARHAIMALAIKNTKMTLEAIGDDFGGRDHSTVIHARDTVGDMLDTNESIEFNNEWVGFKQVWRSLVEKFYEEKIKQLTEERAKEAEEKAKQIINND